MLIAKGIGKDSKVVHERKGVSLKTVVAKGTLPFKVNKVWSIKLQRSGGVLLVFDLLEIAMTAVYWFEASSGVLT